MRLSRLTLQEIGPFSDAVLDFPEPAGQGELVLFEGPNGSGKTTIIEAIAVLLSGHWQQRHVSLEDAAKRMGELPWLCTTPPLPLLLRRIRDPKGAVEATLTRAGNALDVSLRVSSPHGQDNGIRWSDSSYSNAALAALNRFGTWISHEDPIPWAAFAYRAHQPSAELVTSGPRDIEEHPLSGALSFGAQSPESRLLGQLLANLENERTKALAYATEGADEQRRLSLSQLAASRQAAIRRFESVFSEVLGRRTTIEFSVDRQAPAILFDGEPVPLDLLGEGLRSTVAWLSDLLVRLERIRWADTVRSPVDQDFWLLLDEVDESLHPTMQVHILPAVRRLFPNARIYATTHSPFVVASVTAGTIFSIRPDRDHRVRGKIEPRPLEPGQSLAVVTSEIFSTPAEFIDDDTRRKLEDHGRDVKLLEQGREIDWRAFFDRRIALMERNDEVRTAVSMQELSVRRTVHRKLQERDAEASS